MLGGEACILAKIGLASLERDGLELLRLLDAHILSLRSLASLHRHDAVGIAVASLRGLAQAAGEGGGRRWAGLDDLLDARGVGERERMLGASVLSKALLSHEGEGVSESLDFPIPILVKISQSAIFLS